MKTRGFQTIFAYWLPFSILILVMLVLDAVTIFSVPKKEESTGYEIHYLNSKKEKLYATVNNLGMSVCSLGGIQKTVFDSECTDAQCSRNKKHFSYHFKPLGKELTITPSFDILFPEDYEFDSKFVDFRVEKFKHGIFEQEIGFQISVENQSRKEVSDVSTCYRKVAEIARSTFGDQDAMYVSYPDQYKGKLLLKEFSPRNLENTLVLVAYPKELIGQSTFPIWVTIIPSRRYAFDAKVQEVFDAAKKISDAKLRYEQDKISIDAAIRDASAAFSIDVNDVLKPPVEGERPLTRKPFNISSTPVQMPDRFQTATVKISSINLKENLYSAEEQSIVSLQPTTWFWLASATVDEDTVMFRIQYNGQGAEAISDEIMIDINRKVDYTKNIISFLLSNMQWIVGTLLIPIALFLWGKRNLYIRNRSFRARAQDAQSRYPDV